MMDLHFFCSRRSYNLARYLNEFRHWRINGYCPGKLNDEVVLS